MWCQDTFVLPGRQWRYVTLRRRVCTLRPADRMRACSLYVVQVDTARGGCGCVGSAGTVLKITAAERGWLGLSAVPLRLMLFAPTHFYPPFPHLCPTSAENRCSRLLSCEGLLGDRVLMWQHGTFDWKWVTQMWVYKFIIVTISLLSLTCSFLEKSSLMNYISQTLLFHISPMLFISKL